MLDQMKTGPKLVLIAVVIGLGLWGLSIVAGHFGIGIKQSVLASKASLPDIKDAVVGDVKPSAYPTTIPDNCADPIRHDIWEWNAQIGEIYANGGPLTTKGSLVEKHGGCLNLIHQDITPQMQTDLLSCAKELAKPGSTECSSGVQFATIMADQSGAFVAEFDSEASKICPDCIAENVGTTGFSRGEDALWGPAPWKANPKTMLGDGLVAGALREGDWNVALKYEGDNKLKNNPDITTFDVDAVNWVHAEDYIKAGQMYIDGYCEDRKEVKDGKPTGNKVNVCVKGVVTWTPVDVTMAEKKGGLTRVVSTKQYRSQMPSAVIGIRKWNHAHADKIAAVLAATLEAGDQIKAFPEVLKRAGDISAKVYNDQDGAYWVKYYKGTTQRDATGKMVELGGSYADNMNDALAVFGMLPDSNNNFKATYTTFSKIVMEQYGYMFAKKPIPPYDKFVNTSYLLQAKSMLDDQGSAADLPQYSADTNVEDMTKVSNRDYNIEFATGSAVLTSSGVQTVKEIKDSAAIAQGLTLIIAGHTDNTGNPDANQKLSQARAESVKRTIKEGAGADFPETRFRVAGYGSSKPVADNTTTEGKAKNRRVEVTLAE